MDCFHHAIRQLQTFNLPEFMNSWIIKVSAWYINVKKTFHYKSKDIYKNRRLFPTLQDEFRVFGCGSMLLLFVRLAPATITYLEDTMEVKLAVGSLSDTNKTKSRIISDFFLLTMSDVNQKI